MIKTLIIIYPQSEPIFYRSLLDLVVQKADAVEHNIQFEEKILFIPEESAGNSTGADADISEFPDLNCSAIFFYNEVKDIFGKSLKYFSEKGINPEEVFSLIFQPDWLFFDIETNKYILNESIKYDIQYYYGEGFPEGIIGQVAKGEIFEDIMKLSKPSDQVKKNFVFDILLRNISQFDLDLIEGIENYEAYRTSCTLSKKEDLPVIFSLYSYFGNFEIKYDYTLSPEQNLSRIAQMVKDPEKYNLINHKQINDFFINNKTLTRTYPKGIFMEISSSCQFSCIHCPYPSGLERIQPFLSLEQTKKIKETNPLVFKDTSIILGGMGEPFDNKECIEIINYLSREHKVYIETNGSGFTSDVMKKIINPGKVIFIISMDADTEEIYKKLGKKMSFKKLETFIKYYLENYPDNFFIQFVRMHENDDELENFYEKWKKYEDNIIFRKYNNYSNFLENREVADLTPVDRYPCFHLRRDFYILSDGRVALCKSDLNGKIIDYSLLDNLDKENNMLIPWQKSDLFYENHCQKKYHELCRNCNEFYTFYF